MVFDVLLDSVLDTAKMLPFLLLAYLLIEYIEYSKSSAIEKALAKSGRFGFVPGALLGLVPQCGFSAVAANLYGSRVITLGTLLAVFIATSDEAVPLMAAQPESYPALLALLGIKLAWALAVGLLFDVALAKTLPKALRGGYGGRAADVSCHEEHETKKGGILLAALRHTANIYLYILGFTFAFGLLVAFAGEARISAFLTGLGLFQPLVAGLFGLVPNCASSVLITQLYLSGNITFGSVVAGLCTNAGIGLTVLFRANKNTRQNLLILLLLWGLGVLPGLLLHLLL